MKGILFSYSFRHEQWKSKHNRCIICSISALFIYGWDSLLTLHTFCLTIQYHIVFANCISGCKLTRRMLIYPGWIDLRRYIKTSNLHNWINSLGFSIPIWVHPKLVCGVAIYYQVCTRYRIWQIWHFLYFIQLGFDIEILGISSISILLDDTADFAASCCSSNVDIVILP